MDVLHATAWVAGLGAFAGLIAAAHRGAKARIRAPLAILTSAALVYVLTDRWLALALFAVNVALVVGTWRISRTRLWGGWVILLTALLMASKMPWGIASSGAPGNPLNLGVAVWLGFSYLVFRLIHVTVDAHAGRLGDVTLEETLIYALHPASLVAGPIDRARASAAAKRQTTSLADNIHKGLWRILIGVFGKFVVANLLYAFIAVHDMVRNPEQPIGIAWLWLIAYSFYLLADFASYTSIAIGFGLLSGLKLPENFDRPYLSPSIALFWRRWHMTLSSWVRDYIFFPLARALRSKAGDRYRAPIQLVCHLATMGAVGLWHGLSGGFLVWGLWHGLGLFVHGQLTPHAQRPNPEPTAASYLRTAAGIALTFAFVTLGWVFFVADLPTAIRVFARLFGLS
jgi:alginate O-acetyltransferase complex protein AlgI